MRDGQIISRWPIRLVFLWFSSSFSRVTTSWYQSWSCERNHIDFLVPSMFTFIPFQGLLPHLPSNLLSGNLPTSISILVDGSIPPESSLSSSAAMTVCSSLVILQSFGAREVVERDEMGEVAIESGEFNRTRESSSIWNPKVREETERAKWKWRKLLQFEVGDRWLVKCRPERERREDWAVVFDLSSPALSLLRSFQR